ncbi:hypothetical protein YASMINEVIRUS_1256 [Yasminevirus sp. GU-2018]|uniref:Transposase n=1 Tax=Yasminevirus sp. GU-2018 TaxID=2420051 RepID=A0A5K0UB47_9VIRU|nr:hypothetical protein YASMINEVIRUS_1256 [Yasminevirus sp. GU-2018]
MDKYVKKVTEDESASSTKNEVDPDLLYKNPFFLHAFLDEYISSGKGNNSQQTINEFIAHSPEPYKTNFQRATESSRDIQDMLNNLGNFKCKVTLKPKLLSSQSEYSNSYGRYGGYSSYSSENPYNKRYDSEADRIKDVESYRYIIPDLEGFSNTSNVTSGSHVRTVDDQPYLKHTLYGDVKTKIKSDPHKLLLPLLKMSILGEQLVRQKLGDDEKDKLFNIINCFPVRKSNIPKYVKLDTVMLVQLFAESNKRFYYMNINDQKECLWKTYFKLGKRTFRKTNYVFNGSILTDGFTACVCFELKDDNSKNKKSGSSKVCLSEDSDSTQYVTELSDEDKLKLQSKTLVGIDPGWSDIIFCTNGKTEIVEKSNGKKVHKTETFRFSRQQRRKELKTKRYRDILESDKTETVVKGCTVKKAESILSQFNSSSCDYDRCKEYIRVKNRINFELKEYYQKEIHRKLRWYSYLNKMRSDSNMINRFRDKFGSPEDVVILMGDFSKTEVLKGSEPVKGKSVRKLFKDAGYELYLVNEYNTSKKMYETGDDLEKFRKRESVRPYKKGTINLVHGLLRIKSKTSNSSTELIETDSTSQSEIEYNSQKMTSKTTIINRDLNGALNIRLKGKMQLLNREIPEYLKRTKIVEDFKEEIEKTIRMPSKRAKIKVEVKEKIVKVIRRTSSVEPTGSLLRKKQLARSE